MAKIIHGFDEALHYVNRLGFAGSGPIVYRQQALVSATDALLRASGQTSWYHKTFRPFEVRFKAHTSPQGHRFPWLSTFDVRGVDGKKHELSMRSVKPYGNRTRTRRTR